MAKLAYHWLTRPSEDSETLRSQLATNGINALVSPVMQITLHDIASPQSLPDAIILTSRHTAHILQKLPEAARNLPVFCVGNATAQIAKSFGYHVIITGESDAISLLPQILSTLPEGSTILYLSGEEIRVDIPALLNAQKRRVERLICYAADTVSQLTPDCLAALQQHQITSVSFFSVRSAEITAKLLKHHGLENAVSQIDAYCLSLPVAQTAAMSPWKSVQVSASPTSSAMRDLIVSCHAQTVL